MKKTTLVLTFLVLTLIMSGCANKKPEVFFPEDAIVMDKYVSVEDEETNITLNYIYRNGTPDMTIESLVGDNVESATFECTDIADKFYKEAKYKGYKIGIVNVIIDVSGYDPSDVIQIEAIKFNLNGDIITCKFKEPLQIKMTEDSDGVIEPANCVTLSYFNEEFESIWEINKEATIESIGFGKYAKLDNVKTYKIQGYTQDDYNDMEEIELPAKLKKGEYIAVRGDISQADYLNYTYVYDSLRISYSRENGQVGEDGLPLTLLGGGADDECDDEYDSIQRILETIVDSNNLN